MNRDLELNLVVERSFLESVGEHCQKSPSASDANCIWQDYQKRKKKKKRPREERTDRHRILLLWHQRHGNSDIGKPLG